MRNLPYPHQLALAVVAACAVVGGVLGAVANAMFGKPEHIGGRRG